MSGSRTLKATLIGSTALMAISILALPAAPALAACVTTGPVTLVTGANTNAAGCSITGANGYVGIGVAGASISNSGTINVSHTGISLNATSTVSGGITNSGLIETIHHGILAQNGAQIGNGVTNSGTISSVSGGGLVLLGAGTGVSGLIDNSGTILRKNAVMD